MSRQLVGIFGKLLLISVQVAPVFVVLKTCPEPKPETVRNAVAGSVRLTVILVIARLGRPVVILVQLVPPLVLTLAAPCPEPVYMTFVFERATPMALKVSAPPPVRSSAEVGAQVFPRSIEVKSFHVPK